MKKPWLTIILVTFITNVIFSQSLVFSDDFDSYIAGVQLACQNPTDWTTWNLNPCDPVTDAYVSSVYAHSGANSFVVVADNDLVHPWATIATASKWQIDFYNYIPSGFTGYFNTLAHFSGGVYNWGLEVYFNPGGAGALNAGGTVGLASFTYVFDTWVLNRVIVDLDNDVAEYWYNGAMVGNPFQWTLGSGGGVVPLSLEANDFYGNPTAPAIDQQYIDDYTVTDLLFVPVELTSFTANVNSLGQVVLNWETATEVNNQGFEIERRTEFSEYRTVGFVEGNGTISEPRSYIYTDVTVENGINYYRLKQIDFNGTYEYSSEIEVDANGPLTFNLEQNYPNPFNPSTNIKYSVPESGNVKLSVFNTVGEEVAVLVDGFSASGFFEVSFNASNLPSGVYLYKLQSANSVQTKKMMLLK